LMHRDRARADAEHGREQIASRSANLPPAFVPRAHASPGPFVGEPLQVVSRTSRHRSERMTHEVRAGVDDRELFSPGEEGIFAHSMNSILGSSYQPKTRAAFSFRIFRRVSSESGSCRNCSTFCRMDLMPGLGQSVPQIVLSA